MIYIYHHLGLGDHIVCNGLVRYLYKEHGYVTLFCYNHNLKNLQYMYRDLENLTLLPMGSDNEIMNFINLNKIKFYKIGFEKMGKFYHNNTFDKAFYDIVGLDFNIRYDNFFLKRDDEIESLVYNQLNPNNEKYIFVHDDPSRGFSINPEKHRSDLKIIKNDKRFNIFEMMKIYENAEEIHFMESSISALLNSFIIKDVKLFLHKYVRNYDNFGYTKSKNNIIIIN
jgi:hypothetical protein